MPPGISIAISANVPIITVIAITTNPAMTAPALLSMRGGLAFAPRAHGSHTNGCQRSGARKGGGHLLAPRRLLRLHRFRAIDCVGHFHCNHTSRRPEPGLCAFLRCRLAYA